MKYDFALIVSLVVILLLCASCRKLFHFRKDFFIGLFGVYVLSIVWSTTSFYALTGAGPVYVTNPNEILGLKLLGISVEDHLFSVIIGAGLFCFREIIDSLLKNGSGEHRLGTFHSAVRTGNGPNN